MTRMMVSCIFPNQILSFLYFHFYFFFIDNLATLPIDYKTIALIRNLLLLL